MEEGSTRSGVEEAVSPVRQYGTSGICRTFGLIWADNQDESRQAIEKIEERGQNRAADWPKEFPAQKFEAKNLPTPKEKWEWVALATVNDLLPTDQNTTSAAVRYGEDSQLAIFHVPGRGYYATQQMCPHKRAFVLDHGIVGDDKDGNLYVSCP